MITGAQIREARELLGWERLDVAHKAKLTLATVIRAEAERQKLVGINAGQAAAIQRALEAAGVELTNGGQPGVRLKGKNP